MAEPTVTTKLTPLLREPQFIASAIIGAPALVVAYAIGWRLILAAAHGTLDLTDAGGTIGALVALLAANPITVYLAARQYPRGKAVEAEGNRVAAIEASPTIGVHLDGREIARAVADRADDMKGNA